MNKRPYCVNDVADYVIMSLNGDERFTLINLKLQKLIYYIQAWCLGINKERFMNARFEAWVHGPVCRELYDRFKDTKSLYATIGLEDVKNKKVKECIADDDIVFIDYILENYARFSGSQLEAMTHNEEPWINARGNAEPMDKCNGIITDASMLKYYGKRYNEIPE